MEKLENLKDSKFIKIAKEVLDENRELFEKIGRMWNKMQLASNKEPILIMRLKPNVTIKSILDYFGAFKMHIDYDHKTRILKVYGIEYR